MRQSGVMYYSSILMGVTEMFFLLSATWSFLYEHATWTMNATHVCMYRAAESEANPELVSGSRRFWPESESELESVKFGRLRPWSRVPDYILTVDDNFKRMIIQLPETLEYRRLYEKGNISIRIGCSISIYVNISCVKLKCFIALEFLLGRSGTDRPGRGSI